MHCAQAVHLSGAVAQLLLRAVSLTCLMEGTQLSTAVLARAPRIRYSGALPTCRGWIGTWQICKHPRIACNDRRAVVAAEIV